jgi:inorganic pyrophosphatase
MGSERYPLAGRARIVLDHERHLIRLVRFLFAFVQLTDPGWNTLESLDQVPDQLQGEIAHFFTVYKQLENKHVAIEGWYSREDAVREIEAARRRYSKDAFHS